jgi:hypothetical protein
MKGNDLFLDFGDIQPEKPVAGKGKARTTKADKEQSANTLHNTSMNNAPDESLQPAKKTSIKKASKVTHSTAVMDKTEKKSYTQYTTDEIMKSSVEYFKGDELAANVWMNKYALRDGDRIFELNPDMMHHRIAAEFARIERKYPNPMSEEVLGR